LLLDVRFPTRIQAGTSLTKLSLAWNNLSEIPAGDGKIDNFFTVYTYTPSTSLSQPSSALTPQEIDDIILKG